MERNIQIDHMSKIIEDLRFMIHDIQTSVIAAPIVHIESVKWNGYMIETPKAYSPLEIDPSSKSMSV